MESHLFNNFLYLINLSNETQKEVLRKINISTKSPYHWKKSGKARDSNLRKLAKYFSEKLNIPYNLFKNGHALITEDFEQIIKSSQQLRKYETSAGELQYKDKGSISGSDSGTDVLHSVQLSQDEINFVLQLRKDSSNTYPLTKATLDRIHELVARLGGPDSDHFLSALNTFRFFKGGGDWQDVGNEDNEGGKTGDRED